MLAAQLTIIKVFKHHCLILYRLLHCMKVLSRRLMTERRQGDLVIVVIMLLLLGARIHVQRLLDARVGGYKLALLDNFSLITC